MATYFYLFLILIIIMAANKRLFIYSFFSKTSANELFFAALHAMGQSQSNQPFDSALKLDKSLSPYNEASINHYALKSDLETLFRDTTIPSFDFVRSDLPSQDVKHRLHSNMISYFALAWSSHASVVLSPDMVFYTLLAEMAGMYSMIRSASLRNITNRPLTGLFVSWL